MNAAVLFLCGLVLTFAISISMVIYLRPPLRKILTELCGTAERAAFWTAFSGVVLTAVPVIFAMQYHPENSATVVAAFELADQLKWGLIGMVLSITVLAWVVSRFIPRTDTKGKSEPAVETAGE